MFVQPLIDSLEKHFLKEHKLSIHLFTDTMTGKSSLSIYRYKIPSYRFPQATLYRYKIFNTHKQWFSGDYIFYMDVDMLVVSDVGKEILTDGLTAVLHPGFYTSKSGSWETRSESTSYIPEDKRIRYYAGGFQGGKSSHYLKAIEDISGMIQKDEDNKIMPVWHDESAWNKYLSETNPLALTPDYCMVENQKQRKLWGIDHLQPKIIALDKQHDKIRA